MDSLKKYILPIGVVLCGTVVFIPAYDRVLTSRHLIWCLVTILLVLCSKEAKVGNIHLLMFGYLCFAMFSGLFAINKSEWLCVVLRIFLMLAYLSVVEIDKKLLSKTMIVLGLVFVAYFWYDYSQVRGLSWCRGLMRQKNSWAFAHFCVIPFCYYAAQERFWRKLAIVVLALMVLNISLLGSRSVGLAVVISLLLIPNNKLRALIGLVAIGALIRGFSTMSMEHRLMQWGPTLSMIWQNPFGVGAGNWWIQFPHYAAGTEFPLAFVKSVFRFPHNDFLWIWSEMGIGGILCYVGMFATAIRYARKQTWILIFLAGYITVAMFTAPRERPFASLMLVTFLAMVSNRKYTVEYVKFLAIGLVFVTVVFGYRLRASCLQKRLNGVEDSAKVVELLENISPFAVLTYEGLPYLWQRGLAHIGSGRTELGIKEIKQSYYQNPFNVHVLNMTGFVYAMEKDYPKARPYFEQALRIAPEYEEAQINLANLKEINL